MLARLNTSAEVSILPLGLGNHYTSSSKHLIPPGRRKLPYNHSVSTSSKSSDQYIGDPNAPEANMSFRSQKEYFGPDVLVIIGLVMASLGALLTLVSFYCEFKHPAIQATMAGIGPSLVGIGMLFCILRLFFCTFCISKTCCECIADGFRFLLKRCPCSRKGRKSLTSKKKIHPLHVRDIPSSFMNGNAANKLNSFDNHKRNADDKMFNSNNHVNMHMHDGHSVEMMALPIRMEPITEEQGTLSSHGSKDEVIHDEIQEVRVDSITSSDLKEDGTAKDEIDLLDQIKADRIGSSSSNDILNQNINDLVLNKVRY